MEILKKNNRIYFNDNNKAFANISIDHTNNRVKLELIKVIPDYRNRKIATNLMSNILQYISRNLYDINTIILNPLPLDGNGLSHEKLITFYRKFGFTMLLHGNRNSPYLMLKNLF
ncbi:MAG: GNAT family N-acetyltransferase [Campylobacterota bacterium]|nr:GNAT family N-acetyltransferase [Campylobacterota bacterium]